jgi:hypothetical protein
MLPANAASVVDSAEARQLPVLIAEWAAAADARRWLARALRVDLALLVELPHLALTCLARRTAQDAAWFVRAPDVTPEAARAAELAAEWATASGRRLRAVRPPAVPLAAGVLEEYRTSARGELCVSPDGAQLGVVGDDGETVSWDRLSGRRTDRAASAAASGAWAPLLPPPRPAVTWTIARDNTWQHLALVSSESAAVAIDLGVDMAGRAVRMLDEHRAIVDCDDLEGEARHFLVDLRTRRIAWTADGDCAAAVLALAADVAICAGRYGVAIRALARGEARGGWPCPAVDALAVLPSGEIVTRTGAVIRVWERAAQGAELAATSGWTTAQFSPSGDRLVTGGMLCDARTGAPLARMNVNGPGGWLEGGPPSPCQGLVDGAFVELQPFGLHVWDARGGELRVEDRQQAARYDDHVAFDPRGRYYALGQRRTGKLVVRALADGESLFERIVPLATRDPIGFTADGAHVWWHAADGTRWIAPLAERAGARLLAADEPTPAIPPPRAHAVRDGLLVIDDLAIPCDDTEVIASPDGRAFAARRTHVTIAD